MHFPRDLHSEELKLPHRNNSLTFAAKFIYHPEGRHLMLGMHFSKLCGICILFLTGSAAAADIPFVFDETTSDVASYTSSQLEQAYLSSHDLAGVPMVSYPSDDDFLKVPITGGDNSPGNATEWNIGELKKTLDARVEPDNPRVRDKAVILALSCPGNKTINQIASIYGYLKNGDDSKKGWGYVSDPRGIEYFMFANQSLKNGDQSKPPCVGGGDCDDFAIIMSALVESIGGTTRIIMAWNNSTGGHAYTEVYLGQLNAQNSQIEAVINWLKKKFDANKIYIHIDTYTKDVWLNLDWGADENGNIHPGGPFYQGDEHLVLYIRDMFRKTSLNVVLPPFEIIVNEDSRYNGDGFESFELELSLNSTGNVHPNIAMLFDQSRSRWDWHWARLPNGDIAYANDAGGFWSRWTENGDSLLHRAI